MKKKIVASLTAMFIIFSAAVTYMAYAQAGGSDDPVISLSYLKEIFAPEIKSEMTFKVVNVSKGEKVICEAGTEVIQRMGTSSIIATTKGGIADTTDGCDLADKSLTPSNHLLIVPVADGRGFLAKTDCIFMIKGNYNIQ